MGTGIDQRVVLKCFKSIKPVKSVSHKEEWVEAIFEEVCRVQEFLQRLQIVVLDAVWPNTSIKNTFLSHDSYDLTVVMFFLQHPENTWWFENSLIVEILLLHEIHNHVFSSIVKDVLQTFHSFVATDKFLQHLQKRFLRSMTNEKIPAHDGSGIVVKLSTLREVNLKDFIWVLMLDRVMSSSLSSSKSSTGRLPSGICDMSFKRTVFSLVLVIVISLQ